MKTKELLEKALPLFLTAELKEFAILCSLCSEKGFSLEKIMDDYLDNIDNLYHSILCLGYIPKDLITENNLRIFFNEIFPNKQKRRDLRVLYLENLLTQHTWNLVGTPELKILLEHPLLREPINTDRPKPGKPFETENFQVRLFYNKRWIEFAAETDLISCYHYMQSEVIKKTLKKFIIQPSDMVFVFSHPCLEKIITLLDQLKTLQKECSDVLISYLTFNEQNFESFKVFVALNKNSLLKFRSLRETLIEFKRWQIPAKPPCTSSSFALEELHKIKIIQRTIRSRTRERIHTKVFHNALNTKAYPIFLSSAFPDCFSRRLINIMNELSAKQAVINSKEINHFTVVRNLQSIIQTGYLLGNNTLQRSQIEFEANALGSVDASDLDTICFAPARVDPVALWNKAPKLNSLKENSCSIICDLSRLQYPGKNQFFKLVDLFCKPFQYTVKINDSLSLAITKGEQFQLNIELNNKKHSFAIRGENELYYGHFEAINRFCLTRLFSIVNDDLEYKAELIAYLESLNDANLKKVMVIIAQTMTYFSEYNVHGYLHLEDLRIQEIRIFCHEIKYDLRQLSEEDYRKFLQHFVNNEWEADCLKSCQSILLKEETIIPERDFLLPFKVSSDFSSVPPSLFEFENYLETRPHVNNAKDDIFKRMTLYPLTNRIDSQLDIARNLYLDPEDHLRLERLKKIKEGSSSYRRTMQLCTYLYEYDLLKPKVYTILSTGTVNIESFANLLLQIKALGLLTTKNFHSILHHAEEYSLYFYYALQAFKTLLDNMPLQFQFLEKIILDPEKAKEFYLFSPHEQRRFIGNIAALSQVGLVDWMFQNPINYAFLYHSTYFHHLQKAGFLNEITLAMIYNSITSESIINVFQLLQKFDQANAVNYRLFLRADEKFFRDFCWLFKDMNEAQDRSYLLSFILKLMQKDTLLFLKKPHFEIIARLQKNKILDERSWNLIRSFQKEYERQTIIFLLIEIQDTGLLNAFYQIISKIDGEERELYSQVSIYAKALLFLNENKFIPLEQLLTNYQELTYYGLVYDFSSNGVFNQEIFAFIFQSPLPLALKKEIFLLCRDLLYYKKLEFINQFTKIKQIFETLFEFTLLDPLFCEVLFKKFDHLDAIYGSIFQLLNDKKLNQLTYSLLKEQMINGQVKYITYLSQMFLTHSDLIASIYLIEPCRAKIGEFSYACFLLEENAILIGNNFIELFIKDPHWSIQLAISFIELKKNNLLTSEVSQALLNVPSFAKQYTQAFIDLKKAGLFKDETANFIQKQTSYCDINHLVKAMIQLDEVHLLDTIEADDLKLISSLKLRESPKVFKLLTFLLQQIVEIKETKKHKSYYFMEPSKIEEKINAYRHHIKMICNLTKEEELKDIVKSLLLSHQIRRSCNWVGFAFWDSPTTKNLKVFLENEFGQTLERMNITLTQLNN